MNFALLCMYTLEIEAFPLCRNCILLYNILLPFGDGLRFQYFAGRFLLLAAWWRFSRASRPGRVLRNLAMSESP
jgi:hypothetical protein